MRTRRSTTYKKHFRALIDAHGANCFYCGYRAATCIDHIIPYSYAGNNDISNLVPSCMICNLIASDKVFDDVWIKRNFITNKLKRKYKQIAECTCCLLLYEYKVLSPGLFLCAECYDIEYETKYAKRSEWAKWIQLLNETDCPVDAHRKYRQSYSDVHYTLPEKHQLLVDVIINGEQQNPPTVWVEIN